ncbi:DNA internalization-related competence protein ComEC/Rec2 [Lysobacter sp. GX 14042]|uniref:DNA internalization-related competence protein ComEC/Rec2 n=1 Tax=Lysobacter sp. GX 14042 TaxID=2907155 RepID=UPI001F47FDBA|nr:DNA internalization-related competence protein ComEC/Rec2 [Lysobacter sp. GX 14042]MCE7031507.1 DNA internalization-related competence protein ComEC/Rec2 [Lysobacter sp. GX 14042]
MSKAAWTPQSRQPVVSLDGTAAAAPAAMRALGVPVAAALLGGTLGLLLLPVLPPWPLLAVALLAGAAGWWRGRRARWLGALLCGFGLAGLHAGYALSVQLPPDGPLDLRVAGRVVELPDHQARRTAFMLRVHGGSAQDPRVRGRLLRLSWYDGFDGSSSGRDRLRAGQDWEFDLRLRPPGGLRNPGGQDNEKHALARRISGTGYVREPDAARPLSPPRGLQAWREAMADRMAAVVRGGGVRQVQALALGDTRGLADEDWRVLRATGLTHLIAISGFHVGLVAGFFALLVRGLWWLCPACARRVPTPVAAGVAALFGATLYAAAAGFALPTVRTVLMIAVVAMLRLLRRRSGAFESLALAAILILLFDPLAVLGAGFWLSFAGVAWLVWCLPRAGRQPLRDLLGAQGVATVGLLPLTVLLFNQASLAGPLANLVAIPWWSLVVVPLSLLGTGLEWLAPGSGGWAWRLAEWCFAVSWPLFERMAASPLALWWLPEPHWAAVPLALAGAFWLLLPRGLPGRGLALLLWLPLLWPDRNLPAHGEADLHLLDVGQGLSVVVRTAEHAVLYDTGPAVPEGFDAGERVVLPALHALGVRRLERVVVSHADGDHAGGLTAVMAGMPVARLEAPDGAGIEGADPCEAGRQWELDGVGFGYLHPPPHFPYLGNDASCVLRITTVHGSVLLPGDIGEVIERRLAGQQAPGGRSLAAAEVVVVAHHGSRSSSDPEFVAATGARHALVSAGHGNLFGHPRPEVVERWSQAGAGVTSSADGGAVHVRLGAQGIAVQTRRSTHPRLWDARRRAAGVPD